MKKKSGLVLFISFFILAITSAVFFSMNNKPYIVKVLESEAYSYLTSEAKEYVEKIYKDTGEIIHTEKNIEPNQPYLNPQYIEYLSSSEEEKEKYEIIPTPYLLDYSLVGEVNASLPSSYDLRNVNGNNYITPLKNQSTMDICWTFATVEQVESNIMISKSRPYTSSSLILSPRQLDYAASNNAIIDYTNENGSRPLGTGGNFFAATGLLMNGLGLMKETDMPFDTSYSAKELSSVFNYNKSMYEVDGSILFPTINSTTSASAINANVNLMKEYIMNYGGLYVETEAPDKSCDIVYNGNHLIRVDNGCDHDSGHAMQVIGWNDNFSYSYCKSNNKHVAYTSGCSNPVTGTGAWLLRNSWGTYESYVYLAYDSMYDNFYAYTALSPMPSRTWTNNYHNSFNPTIISYPSYEEETFTKTINTAEKLQKIKFFSYVSNSTYNVYVVTGGKTYTIGSYYVQYPGVYTVNAASNNIILYQDKFTIIIEGVNGGGVVRNMISVFTSNVDSTPSIKSSKASYQFPVSTSNYTFRLYANTKNIDSGSTITFNLYNKSGTSVNTYLTTAYNTVAKNDMNAKVTIKSTIPVGQYNLKLSYGSKDLTIPIIIGDGEVSGEDDTIATVTLYANNNTSNKVTQTVNKNTSFSLANVGFIKTGYVLKNWNTKPDGTGTSYSQNQTISSGINADLTLYAQWTPITYTIKFDNNGGSGTMSNQTFTYDVAQSISNNTFTYSQKEFASWNTKANGTGTSFNNQESIMNLSTTYNDVITLYAQWQTPSYRVVFDKNGGYGIMNPLTFTVGQTRNLSMNIFLRTGYSFKGWNTKANGTGTSYEDKASFTYNSTNSTIIIYAQWQPNTYSVTFNANGGSGSMAKQNFTYGTPTALLANQFTRSGYIFESWNTKADGTGVTYFENEKVTNITSNNNETVTLYAQWKPGQTYSITGYTVDNSNNLIDGISELTTLATYRNHFTLGSGYSLTIELNGNSYIYTGSISKIYANGALQKQYTNIVRGDINADGKIASQDYIKVRKHIMGTEMITGTVYQKAADANKDSNINSLDYIRIRNIIMNR